MKHIDDIQLEQLLKARAAEKKQMEQASKVVVKTVARQMRLNKIIKWLKVLTYTFVIPISIVVYTFLLYHLFANLSTPISWLCVGLPIATIAFLYGNKIINLHIDMN